MTRSSSARGLVKKEPMSEEIMETGLQCSRRLTVLSVAYPLAPIGPDAVGGSEQILTLLDAALMRAGHRSIVVACEGSAPRGALIAIPRPGGALDDAAMRRARARCAAAIREALRRERIDVIHLHGLDFHAYLPPPGPPTLATLHLPPWMYPEAALRPDRPATYLCCVSASQRARCPATPVLLDTIPNGVPLDALRPGRRRRRFALALGRICPEKGLHLALDAATRAGVPLLLAGEVFGYPEHLRYFEQEILPRVRRGPHRLLGPVGLARKRRLLGAARCLLVPSLIDETSSLIAMEALASGAPVIAFAAGALPEIVEHGSTGWIVDGAAEMARAIALAHRIDPASCRRAAEQRFSADRMTRDYLSLYLRLAAGEIHA